MRYQDMFNDNYALDIHLSNPGRDQSIPLNYVLFLCLYLVRVATLLASSSYWQLRTQTVTMKPFPNRPRPG